MSSQLRPPAAIVTPSSGGLAGMMSPRSTISPMLSSWQTAPKPTRVRWWNRWPSHGFRRLVLSQSIATLWTLFAAYQVFASPVMLAFDWRPRNALFKQATAYVVIDWLAFAVFSMDIVVKLLLSDWQLRSDPLAGQPARVARRYLHSPWFFLDVVATLPWALLVEAACTSCSQLGDLSSAVDCSEVPQRTFPEWGSAAQAARLLILTRLIRVPQLDRLFRAWAREAGPQARLVHLTFFILLLANTMGCAFWFVAELEKHDGTWTSAECLHIETAGLTDRYVASVYAAVLTLTTIGYGDIVPQTTQERAFVIFSSILGSGVFAYAIGRIASLAHDLHVEENAHDSRLDALNMFARQQRLPKSLSFAIRGHALSAGPMTDLGEHESLLDSLPAALRKQVEIVVCSRALKTTPLLVGLPDGVAEQLAAHCSVRRCARNEAVCVADEPAHLYVLIHGTAEREEDGMESTPLPIGGCDGVEGALLPGRRHLSSMRALSGGAWFASVTSRAVDTVCETNTALRDRVHALRLRLQNPTTGAALPDYKTEPTVV